MYEIQKVLCKNAGIPKEVFVMFVYNLETNLRQSIHDATLEYCIAERQKGHVTPFDMTLQDFVESVPNTLCEKYGFQKIMVNDVAEDCDGSRVCLDECDLHRHLEDRKKLSRQKKAMEQVFGSFGMRMEAAQKKSPAVAGWSFHQITKQMLVWAEEFADKYGEKNIYGHYDGNFVSEKLKEMRQAEKMERPQYK